MVPSPGHGEGCDGGMEAVKAGHEMGPVHWGGQDLWPFVHREVFHERFRVGLIPAGMVLSCKEAPKSWGLCWMSSAGFQCWRSLVQDGHGSPHTSGTRRMRWGSILLTPHLNPRD